MGKMRELVGQFLISLYEVVGMVFFSVDYFGAFTIPYKHLSCILYLFLQGNTQRGHQLWLFPLIQRSPRITSLSHPAGLVLIF